MGPVVMALCVAGARAVGGRSVWYCTRRLAPLRVTSRIMSRRPRPRPIAADRRVHALLALLCALGLIGAAPPCSAARQVHVYEVDVEGQTSPALQEAMRQVLVRATGRR